MNQLGARGSVETTRRWGPYPYYKDSGVEWLGEIPEHWSIMPIKRIFYILNGSTPKSSEPSYWSGSISWATPDDLGSLETDTLKITKRMITQEGYESCGTQLAPTGSLVLSTRAPIGHLAIAGVPLCINQGCRCLVFREKTQNRFYYYQLLAAKQELESWGQGSTFKELSRDKLVSVSLVSPTLDEQQAITAFLDRETSRIDTLIAKKQRQIELLQEKRTALISHAVTKGLNPEAKMKDSGIEWLGEIPEHWGVFKIKHVASLHSGHTPSRQHPEYWEDCTIPWFSLADVWQIRDGIREYLDETKEKISTLGIQKSSAELLPAGTVVVSRTASVGFSGIMSVSMATTQDFANWVCGPKIMPEYLLYVFRSMGEEFKRLIMGSTHKTIYMPDVATFVTPLPPLHEQNLIVQYVQKKKQDIERLKSAVSLSIAKLEEYRTALISAAVTGKIDVRKDVA